MFVDLLRSTVKDLRPTKGPGYWSAIVAGECSVDSHLEGYIDQGIIIAIVHCINPRIPVR